MFASITTKFYTYSFLEEFVLIYPFYALLFSDKGLDAAQITILLVVWSATAFVLEIPSGAIADKFSRKYVLMSSLALKAVAFSMWLIWPSFWGFMTGFVLWGISSALASGTQEALVYDELARDKRTSLYAKVTGRMESFGLVGAILAGFVASALAGLGYGFMLICSVVVGLLSLAVIASLPRSKQVESTGESEYFHYLLEGVKEATHKPVILLVILFSSIVTGIAASDEYFNLLFREKGLDNGEVAFWIAIVSVFSIAGSLVAHKFEKKIVSLELLLLVWAASLFGAVMIGGLATPIFIGIFSMIYYGVKVLFTTYLQNAVNDETRATTVSVGGFLSELGALSVFAIIGWFAQEDNYSRSFLALAVVIVIAAAAFWLIARLITKKYHIEKLGL